MAAKKKISKIQVFRFLVQVIFFIFLPGLYANAFLGIKVVYQGVLNGTFYFPDDFSSLISAIAIFPITFLLGRFFCGWMCAFGAMGDWLFSISRNVFRIKVKVNPSLDKGLKFIKYIVLVLFFALVWIINLDFLNSSNPWSVFGILAKVTQLPDFAYVLQNFIFGFIFLLFIMICSLFVERFFCRYLCPLGAVFAIISRFSITKIRKTKSNCGSCKLCTVKCSMGINLDKYDVVKSGECIQCYKCVSVCPKNNAVPSVLKRDLGSVFGSVVAVLAITAVYFFGTFVQNNFATGTSYTAVNIKDHSGTGLYVDGFYEGVGSGFRGNTIVSVTVERGYITNIDVVSYQDDTEYFNRSFDTVASNIIYLQTTSVDAVSGATYSSNGIMAAVKDALKNASSTTTETTASSTTETTTSVATQTTTGTTANSTTTQAATTTAPVSSSVYIDGTYIGNGTGFRGTTSLSVTISGDRIADITLISYRDDAQYFNNAYSTVVSRILSSQTSNVQIVSGATYSSNGIKAAVENALSQARR